MGTVCAKHERRENVKEREQSRSKQLARGFAEVACDYAVSKRDYEKTMKGEGLTSSDIAAIIDRIRDKMKNP